MSETEITGKALSLIIFYEVFNIQFIRKAINDFSGIVRRPIFNNQNFKMFISLQGKCFQQFPDLLRTVI